MPLKRQYQCHHNTANSKKKIGAKVSVSTITIIVSTSGPTPGIRVRFLHPVPYNRHTNPLEHQKAKISNPRPNLRPALASLFEPPPPRRLTADPPPPSRARPRPCSSIPSPIQLPSVERW
ncbi:uncharacterized protein M6B38_189400 [Iris pallida]|uniref:Uncharacterized protein n=1 Tax=Iris pallida TaxID=29817 RepID=A0AAX6EIA5_IRIPA|nr:uncharacterized protein M6B38_189400 [Iris pallida]